MTAHPGGASAATALPSGAPATRIAYVDVAKALGILLVFYGHLIECFFRSVRQGDLVEWRQAALEQWRWIYCFHMPLFFFLSGLVYKERSITAETFLKRQTLSRLTPVWVFNFISMVLVVFIEFWTRSNPATQLATIFKAKAVRFGWETLCGRPFFNVLVWFLVCLFVVELIQFALRKPFRRTLWLVVSMAVFAGITHVFTCYRSQIADIWGSLPFDMGLLKIDFWQFSSVVAAIVFYQGGILFQRVTAMGLASRRLPLVAAGAVGLVVTLVTLNYNKVHTVAYVAHGAYGNVGWFFLTAFAGILFMVGLSSLLSFSGILARFGQITLGLMCLNGILHGLVNLPLAQRVAPLLPKDSVLILTATCVGLTLLSVAVCLPIVWLIERYVPVVLGRWPSRTPSKAASAAN